MRPLVIQSARLSILLPSVCPSGNTCPEHIFSPLDQFWFILHPQSSFWCAVILNYVSRKKIKVIAELNTKYLSVSYIISPWYNLAHINTQNSFGQKVCSDLNDVQGQILHVSNHIKKVFSAYTLTP